MPEICPHCGKEFANTKALGSHIHYVHENRGTQQVRSEEEHKRFQTLLGHCLTNMELRKPRNMEKMEQAISEIPKGISEPLDQYREAFQCAYTHEKLLKEVLEDVLQETLNEETT